MIKIEVCHSTYTSSLLLSNKDKLFVFGDNMSRWGKKGQAVIRDSSNAFGVATKRYPSMENASFFSDQEDEMYIMISDLRKLYRAGEHQTIVFPSMGIGTGLSDMRNRSPLIWVKLNEILLKHFSFNNEEVK